MGFKNKLILVKDLIHRNMTPRVPINYLDDLDNVLEISDSNERYLAVIIDDRESDQVFKVVSDFVDCPFIDYVLHIGGKFNTSRFNDCCKYLRVDAPFSFKRSASYNYFMMSPGFWGILSRFEKVMVFQHDVKLLKDWSDFDLGWWDYDYIGAEWEVNRPNGLQIPGGCGGFSIRNPRLHAKICARYNASLWLGGEDGFFAYHTQELGGRVADMDAARKFCCQFVVSECSFAIHKISHSL